MFRDKSLAVAGYAAVLVLPFLLAACQEPAGQAASDTKAPALTQAAAPPPNSAKLVSYIPNSSFSPLQNCNLEAIGSEKFGPEPLVANSTQNYSFEGWIDASALASPMYWLRIDDQQRGRFLRAPLSLSVARPDVVATHPGAAPVTGFMVNLPSGSIPSGEYHVYLAVNSGGSTYICDNGRELRVK